MNDTAQTITAQRIGSPHADRVEAGRPGSGDAGDGARWPVPVVVIDEHIKDPLQVLLVQN